MTKYKVRLNCPAFYIIEVEAETKEEAIQEALLHFQCDCSEGEFDCFVK